MNKIQAIIYLFVAIVLSVGASVPAAAETPCWITQAETCVDGPATRHINGLVITRDCWAYRTEYSCGILPQVDSCDSVRNTPGCLLSKTTCSASDANNNCTQNQYTFECTAAGAVSTKTVCGSDVYCGNGDCVGSAVSGPNSFGQGYGQLAAVTTAMGSFDPATATMLKGYEDDCRKQLNGALNCCDFGGILNGVLSCNQQEKDLATADQDKRDYYVGKYCSKKVLGVCVEEKWAFCVFQSLLSRLIQVQGRAQLGIGWGVPTAPNCQGLTMAQFMAIDFSKIDFSEYMATVTVPQPNGSAATTSVQNGINSQTIK